LTNFARWKKNSTSLTNLGATYGIFHDQNGLAIHNRIYRKVIDEGFLLIFDPRVNKDWKSEETFHQGKLIFAVWV
jgi:hypothetical protein